MRIRIVNIFKTLTLIVIDACFLYLFVEEIHIPGARPIMAPTNVGGGGGSVGVLTITWKVSIYNNPLYRKRAGKSLTVQISRFEII